MTQVASISPEMRSNPVFVLGQNGHGQWVIRELHGLMEGLFADRKDAIRFACEECGSRTPSIIPVNGPLESAVLN
jgi:hypothetical protein